MVSEAAATGKPVYVFDLGKKNQKFNRFYDKMKKNGVIRVFDGNLTNWQYDPPDNWGSIALEIKGRLQLD